MTPNPTNPLEAAQASGHLIIAAVTDPTPPPASPPTLYTHRITYTTTLTHEVVVEVALPHPTREAFEKDNPDEDPISLIINDPDSKVVASEIIDTIGDREVTKYTITAGATPNATPALLEPSSPTL